MDLLLKPFGNIIESSCTNKYNGEKLDAIYIPSLEYRQPSEMDLFLLTKYTKEIVFLYTNDVRKITIDKSVKVRIERLQSYHNFLSTYISQRGNKNKGVNWRSSFDIPHKRSFALSDARNRNYKKILLIDDDLHLTENNIVSGIVALQSIADIIGFHVIDYPDVSTIDHLERIILQKKNIISMTGSCLFLNVESVIGDFPNVYNEDLFFFLSQPNPARIRSGGMIFQNVYTPWLNKERVCHEQFGDLIYDSIKKRLLGETGEIINWTTEIEDRINRIHKIKQWAHDEKQIDALSNAISCLQTFSESDINEFVLNYPFADWVKKYFR